MIDNTPQVGEVWQDKRGKRRLIIDPGDSYRRVFSVHWRSVGPNHGQNEGWMEPAGWLRRGWKRVEES